MNSLLQLYITEKLLLKLIKQKCELKMTELPGHVWF